jgi:arabinose-5-phosphate isomerase
VMHDGDSIPSVSVGTPLSDALLEMSTKGFGLTTIIDDNRNLLGVFSDGDLRRTLDSGRNIQSTKIEDVMSTKYKSISSGALAAEAARLMQESNIYVLIVKDDDNTIAGIVKMHDLLQANVV